MTVEKETKWYKNNIYIVIISLSLCEMLLMKLSDCLITVSMTILNTEYQFVGPCFDRNCHIQAIWRYRNATKNAVTQNSPVAAFCVIAVC